MLRGKKGQSTLEYIIIFSVIVVAVFILAYKALSPGVGRVMNKSADGMKDAVNRFVPVTTGKD